MILRDSIWKLRIKLKRRTRQPSRNHRIAEMLYRRPLRIEGVNSLRRLKTKS